MSTGNNRMMRRFLIVAAVLAALVLIDGIVLAITGGLSSDATPVFPVLGGSFAKTRNSGTSLIILGVLMELVVIGGWWARARKARRAGSQAQVASRTPDGDVAQPLRG